MKKKIFEEDCAILADICTLSFYNYNYYLSFCFAKLGEYKVQHIHYQVIHKLNVKKSAKKDKKHGKEICAKDIQGKKKERKQKQPT